MTTMGTSIAHAVTAIRQGGVVIYPTEGVFGIGCDYRVKQSVQRILKLKERSVNKGLVLIASHIQQILPLVQPLKREHLARALKTWPGHHTWVFPASPLTPKWITGDFDSVALRVSDHPVVKSLCDELGHALVSTSANISNQPTPNNCKELQELWQNEVNYYLDLPLGSATGPSTIRLVDSGEVIR
ncbi:MAG: Sua5/YciO/YrdC/YwlC family protein [Marinicella sp.]